MDTKGTAQRAGKIAVRVVLGLIVLGVAGVALYTEFTLHYSYSEGDRVGVVQKVSTKGWLCKTNEGELAMTNVIGQPAQIYAFTVRDEAVMGQIKALEGQKVAIHYEEHRGVPSSCFGDTAVFVTGVKKTE